MLHILAHTRYDKLIIWALCVCLVAMFGSYMYFITTSVVEAVLHTSMVSQIREAESEVSLLESKYFEHLNALTPDTLPDYKLVAATPAAYVSIDDSGGKLTRRD